MFIFRSFEKNFLYYKINKQPESIKKRLDELEEKFEENDIDYFQLKVIKKKRVYPEIGDVFAVNPVEGVCFWGVVVNNHINIAEGDDLLVVMIFDEKINISNVGDFQPDFKNLLINPSIVGHEYWTRGFFYNIGKIDDIQFPTYGFYDGTDNMLFDEYGKRMWKRPALFGLNGVSTIIGIGFEIYCELIIRKYF